MARAVREREISPVELVDAHVARIEALDPDINAVVLPRFEQAREEARAAEQAVQRGDATGPLHGVPFTAKEAIEVAGMPCNDGSKIFEGNVSAEDAVVVRSLREAGAILLGKTNIPEFALHYDSNNAVYGATGNPHDLTRTAGGSSGGEAAALVAGMSAFGVGSDYGGSIRVPSSFCGCVGIKPGRFVVPRTGHFPPMQPMTVQQWSVIGPMARYVEDLELLLPIFARPDQVRDPDCGVHELAPANVDGARVAVYWEDGVNDVEPAVREAVEAAGRALADAGHDVVEQRPPLQVEARKLFRAAALGEITAGLAPLVGDRRNELSPQMQVMFDTLVDNADTSLGGYVGRLLFEGEIERQLAAWQAEHPIAIAPISPCPAFPLGADNVDVNGTEVPMIELMSFSTHFNQTGVPAAAVPIATSPEGLPIGVQVVGRRDREMEVLAVASKLEQAFGGWVKPVGVGTGSVSGA
ncbi:MAG: amidase [Solirubrobacterales bacterium]